MLQGKPCLAEPLFVFERKGGLHLLQVVLHYLGQVVSTQIMAASSALPTCGVADRSCAANSCCLCRKVMIDPIYSHLTLMHQGAQALYNGGSEGLGYKGEMMPYLHTSQEICHRTNMPSALWKVAKHTQIKNPCHHLSSCNNGCRQLNHHS